MSTLQPGAVGSHALANLLDAPGRDGYRKPSMACRLCTFWYIGVLASVGRQDEALALFNTLVERRNKICDLRGDHPQALQVGLIQSAMRLSRTWEEEELWDAS